MWQLVAMNFLNLTENFKKDSGGLNQKAVICCIGYFIMAEKVLIGYTGSWAGHMSRYLKIKGIKNNEPEPTPVYVSKKKHKELMKFQELEYLSNFL